MTFLPAPRRRGELSRLPIGVTAAKQGRTDQQSRRQSAKEQVRFCEVPELSLCREVHSNGVERSGGPGRRDFQRSLPSTVSAGGPRSRGGEDRAAPATPTREQWSTTRHAKARARLDPHALKHLRAGRRPAFFSDSHRPGPPPRNGCSTILNPDRTVNLTMFPTASAPRFRRWRRPTMAPSNDR